MVAHRKGEARNQMAFSCLEELIADDNIVRVIDAFVDILDFKQLGFAHIQPKKTGSPPYHPALLLRIYLYGYLNRVRSSRKLETECRRNIEMQWLCERQVPCYHTIADFRTYKSDDKAKEKINHRNALKEVFRAFNRFLNGEALFGKETVATDGTKIRAQNAKKKNYTEDKLNKKLERSEASIAQYLDELEQYDKAEALTEALTEEQTLLQTDAKTKLEQLKKWNTKFKELKQELTKRQEQDPEITQISQTDPDARSIVINNSGHAEVAYNIVTAVDDKYKLIANYLTENIKDTTLLADSLIAVKAEFDTHFNEDLHKTIEINENTEGGNAIDLADNLVQKLNKNTTLNGLADKGFHAATQLQECADNNIMTYVAIPQLAYSGKDKDFTIHNFMYNETDDTYTCPHKQTLTTNGKLYHKKNKRGIFVTRYKSYSMSPTICAKCPFVAKCLPKSAIKNHVSRRLECAEHQNAVNDNKLRLETIKGKLLYRKRQAIVEHPFGIIKRQWATDHTLLRGLDKVNAEFAIVFTCYNLRRAVTILSAKTLIEKLKAIKNTHIAAFYFFFRTSVSQLHFMLLKILILKKVAYNEISYCRTEGVG